MASCISHPSRHPLCMNFPMNSIDSSISLISAAPMRRLRKKTKPIINFPTDYSQQYGVVPLRRLRGKTSITNSFSFHNSSLIRTASLTPTSTERDKIPSKFSIPGKCNPTDTLIPKGPTLVVDPNANKSLVNKGEIVGATKTNFQFNSQDSFDGIPRGPARKITVDPDNGKTYLCRLGNFMPKNINNDSQKPSIKAIPRGPVPLERTVDPDDELPNNRGKKNLALKKSFLSILQLNVAVMTVRKGEPLENLVQDNDVNIILLSETNLQPQQELTHNVLDNRTKIWKAKWATKIPIIERGIYGSASH